MARNKVGVPYEDPIRYVGPGTDLIPIIKVSRKPTATDKRFPLGQFWLVGDDPSTGEVGELYYLCDYLAGVPQWCQVTTSGTNDGIDGLTGSGGTTVAPDASGNVLINASVVANGTNAAALYVDDGTASTLTIEGQLGAARTGAPADSADAGLVSFDDTAFNVDANGYVTLVGGAGPVIDSIGVDAAAGAGTDPVVPDGNGLLTVSGSAVAANSLPVRSVSNAANAYDIEVQVAKALTAAPGDKDEAGLASFSDDHFVVDTDGHVLLKNPGAGAYPGVSNLGISLSGGTFKVTGADGTALSATNPAYVTLPTVANPGQLATITVTDDYQFIDDNGTSTVAGMLWGTTTAVDWGNDMPFFLYAIMNDDDDEVAFAITRSPAMEQSYASSNIGANGTIVTTNQNTLFLLDASTGPTTPTIGEYDENPAILIGSFRMQKTSGASNDWTVQTLDDRDGIGRFNWSTRWDMPTGVNGSASSTYFQDVTGTEPQFSSSTVNYQLFRNGLVYLIHEHNTATTAGTGAGDLRPTLPMSSITGTDAFRANRLTTTPNNYIAAGTINGGNIYLQSFYEPGAASAYTNATIVSNSSFTVHALYKGFA